MGRRHNYRVSYKNGSIKVAKNSSINEIYRLPYETLSPSKCEFDIDNNFIVYILYEHNFAGKDFIYVGKSKNGIFGRPKQHTDKFTADVCYIMTQRYQGTFFNDGTIQYMEDQVNQKINATNAFTNTTETTNKGTVNPSEKDDCDEYLEDAYEMLDVLGLNFNISIEFTDKKVKSVIKDKSDTYYTNKKDDINRVIENLPIDIYSPKYNANVVGYCLSRLDKDIVLHALGYNHYKDAYEGIGEKLNKNPNTLKNIRDAFDPYLPNNPRAGWYQRDLRPQNKVIFDCMAKLSDDQVLEIAKSILEHQN